MPTSLEERYEKVRIACEAAGQGQLLRYWSELTEPQRAELLDDLERIDFAPIPNLIEQYVRRAPSLAHGHRLEPAPVVHRPDPIKPDEPTRRAIARGEELLRAGKVAALTVAGGQGTRLGYDGPKGCFRISPVRRKPLFQLFAEQIAAAGRRAGRDVRWYLMTSPGNDAATQAFFREHSFFGLRPEQVVFFQQGVMPAFATDGKVLLDEKHRVALSPDGHGGSLLAMASRGILADMARHGIELISYFQVDNPLVRCVDPLFLGLHDLRGAEMSSKMVPKVDDKERVGNFATADGRVIVIEYSDLPDELAVARNPDGTRRFDAGNIAIHALSRRFVERLTHDPKHFALPWHRAEKKVPCIDLATGRRIEPTTPNAVKLEAFIFDALPLSDAPSVLLETDRAEEFSPVKNATGVDSVDTAQRDMTRRAARWLEAAGVRVPRRSDGEPTVPIEISPLRAMDAGDLQRCPPSAAALAFDGPLYLE